MRRLLRFLLLTGLAALLLLSISRPTPEPPLPTGAPAPPLALPALGGGELALASLRGRVVVLNFWASWCPPCVEEMPWLEGLHRALGPEGLAVLSVSVDENSRALARFVEEAGLTFPVLRDPSGVFAEEVYRVYEYPTTYLIDAQGVVLQRYVGPVRWDAPEAIENLRQRLPAGYAPPERERSTSPTR